MGGLISRLNKALSGQSIRRSAVNYRPHTERGTNVPKEPSEVAATRPGLSDLTAALPHGTARLTVTRNHSEGAEIYGISGACCCGIDLPYIAPSTQSRPARLALGSLITPDDGGESPAETFTRLRSWAVHLDDRIPTWLARIREAHGDDLRLIILDLTDYDLPWELLWLGRPPRSELPDGWLGALVTVARSTTAAERQRFEGAATNAKCKGNVAAFIHNDMRADRKLFKHLSTRIWSTSLDEFFLQLDQPGDPLGLVYVACHGKYPSSKPGTSASGAKIQLIYGGSEGNSMTVRDIDWRTFEQISSSRSMVFLNACHSGRQAFDPELNDGALRGFAEVFLRSGASGFIGTVGAVGLQAGHEVARNLLTHLRHDNDVPVATALRDYRRRVADAAPTPSRATDSVVARGLFPLFHAFMYVYYGSPDSTVELQRRGPRS